MPQKGFAPFVILIIIATLIASVGYFTLGKKFELVGPSTTTFYKQASLTNAPTPSPSAQTPSASSTSTPPRTAITPRSSTTSALNKPVKFICEGGGIKKEALYEPNTGERLPPIQVYLSSNGQYYKQVHPNPAYGDTYYDLRGRVCVLEGSGVWESEQYSFCLESAKTLTYRQEDLCETN